MTENESKDARIDELKKILANRPLWEQHWAEYVAAHPQNTLQEPI